jgi:hypothetical protein
LKRGSRNWEFCETKLSPEAIFIGEPADNNQE